jgi:superfamily I DNA/RNA helicase
VDLIRDARQLIETRHLPKPYKAVIVDEAQDMSAEAFRLLRTLVEPGTNDLFIVGDAHQRIYRHKVSLAKCGIDIRGRGKKLKINYRTTDEIRRFAVELLEGRAIDDLNGGEDDQKGYMSLSHGAAPKVLFFDTAREELEYLASYIRGLVEEGVPHSSICLATRTHRLVENYMHGLASAELPIYEIKRKAPEARERPGVRVATMHRVKGLEFDHVIVAAANENVIPLPAALASADDAITSRDLETGERALLYVAVTRAKRSALITCYGAPSPFLTANREMIAS